VLTVGFIGFLGYPFPIFDCFRDHRSAPGYWLVWAPSEDPFLPATVAVAAVEEPAYSEHARRSEIVVRPFDTDRKRTRGEINNLGWRGELLQCARLLDRLVPDHAIPSYSTCRRTPWRMSFEGWRGGQGGRAKRALGMSEGGDDDSVEITPEMAEALRALCARRGTMTDDAFADALSEVLEIPRVMLDQATTITAAGLRGDVEARRLTFEEAYWLARMKN
jgi:hypothetical protein